MAWFDEDPATDLTDEERRRLEEYVAQTVSREQASGDPAAPTGSFTDDALDYAWKATGGVRQAAGGFAGTMAAAPWNIGASLAALPAIPARAAGYEAPAEIATWLAETGQKTKKNVEWLTGAGEEPETPVEKGAKFVGENVVPFGRYTAPLTAAQVGIKAATDWLFPTQQQADITGFDVDEQQRAPAPAPRDFSPPAWLTSAIVPSAEAQERGAIVPEPSNKYQFVTGVPETVLDTVGGPKVMKTSELWTLGILGAASIGMAGAPWAINRFRSGSLPTVRPVRDAAPGTDAISTVIDLAREYDEAGAGALRLARRAGVDPATIDHLTTTARTQTRMAAQSLGDSAILAGRAESPNFRFQTRVPLASLGEAETPEFARYMHLRDTMDDLNAIATAQQLGRRPNTGPSVVRGMTVADVTREMHAIEQAFPEVQQFAQGYRENLRDLRRFEASGEYATLSRAEAQTLNANRSNTVPFESENTNRAFPILNPTRRTDIVSNPGKRIMEDANFDRGSPTASLAAQMRLQMRLRMENEYVGTYVDAARQAMPELFTRVTKEQLKQNPHWEKNTVTFKRRGVNEYYTTDPFLADVLKMDPYYMTGMAPQALFGMKRLMEMTTTGALAPWFATTSLLRNHNIIKLTAPMGRSANALQTAAAIPQQLYPQLARAISSSLDRTGSLGWMRNVFGDNLVNGFSQRLAADYDRSLYAQLQSVGSHRGSILEQQTSARNQLTQAISQIAAPLRPIYQAYSNVLNAVHNAPSFAFARKNYSRVPLSELALEARRMTGDPRTGGQYYTSKGRPIRFQPDEGIVSHTGAALTRGYGMATEFGRTAVPWYNATVQGVKRIGEAYINNPASFVGKAWLYTMLPAAASYLLARHLDKDPNGLSYVDYMMNRRSDYKKTMNYYIPIPGLPAEYGIEFPRFHEMAGAARLMESAMDHAFGTAIFTEKEDFKRTLSSILGVAVEPPMPPVLNLAAAQMGFVSTGGPFSGEFYQRKQQPFDQTSGLPNNIELYMRAIAPGIADVVGAGAAAFIQTPEGIAKAFGNALKEGGKRASSKTPLLRDWLGDQPPIAGNTNVTDELFKRQAVIRQLTDFYSEWTKNQGQIETKPKSKEGGFLIENLYGPHNMPSEPAGLSQPAPTNPLYNMFIEEVYNKFRKDAPVDRKGNDTGAIGFQTLWSRYGDATKNIQRMRNINEGNWSTWQAQLQERPEQLKYLRDNGVDTTKPKDVRSFYEKQRQDTARIILFTIRAVENDLSQKAGRPIKLEDIKPYGKGIESSDASEPLELSLPY